MKKMISIMIIILLIAIMLCNVVYADAITDSMHGYDKSSGTSTITTMGGKILSMVQLIGVIVSIIMLSVLGIKYMITSPSEKAEVKKTLTPYIIGAIILFSGSTFLQIAKMIADGINLYAMGGGYV